MQPLLSRSERDVYWQKLTRTFPHVPAELAFEKGSAVGPKMKHGTSVLSCRYSLDGKHIFAAGGGRIPWCDSAIRVFDSKTGSETLLCRGHVCGIYELVVDPFTGFLASASEDYSVVLWNVEQQDAIFLVGGDPIVKGHVAFASEKHWLAIGETGAYEDLGNSAFVIDLDSGREVFRQKLNECKQIAALTISADGANLVVAVANHQHNPKGSELFCWDLLQGNLVWKQSIDDIDISELHWLPGEERLAAAVMVEEESDYLSGVCLLDARSGLVLTKKLWIGIGSNVAVPTGGQALAVAGDFGIELLDANDLTPFRKLVEGAGKEYGSGFCSVQFSRDGKSVLAGNAEGELQTFAIPTDA